MYASELGKNMNFATCKIDAIKVDRFCGREILIQFTYNMESPPVKNELLSYRHLEFYYSMVSQNYTYDI